MKLLRRLILHLMLLGIVAAAHAGPLAFYNVTCSPDFCVGAQNITGALNFGQGPPPMYGWTYTFNLVSSNPSVVSAPSTCTIGPSNPSGAFTATVAAVTKPTVVTITATCGQLFGFCKITAAPSNASAAPPYVRADGGQGGVVVRWQPTPASFGQTLVGYNVVRKSGSTSTTLNAAPITATEFWDFTAATGTTYTYTVNVVNASGATIASLACTSSAATTGATLTWQSPPTISGTQASFEVNVPGGASPDLAKPGGGGTPTGGSHPNATSGGGGSNPPIYKTVVNGLVVGRPQDDNGLGNYSTGYLMGTIDLFRVTSPTLTVRVVADTGSTFTSTSSYGLTEPTQAIGNLVTPQVVYAPNSTYATFSCNLNPSMFNDHLAWMVTLTYTGNPNITLPTWIGPSSNVFFEWNGLQTNGAPAPSGLYTANISMMDANFTPQSIPVYITVASQAPNLLAMTTDLYSGAPWGPDNGSQYAAVILSNVNTFIANNGGYTAQVIYLPPTTAIEAPFAQLLRSWLQSSNLWDIYLYCHGSHTSVHPFGQLQWYSYAREYPDGTLVDTVDPAVFSIPNIVASRYEGFHWIFLDGCNTYGDATDDAYPSSTDTTNWLNAWTVQGGSVPPDVLMGWNGHGIENNCPPLSYLSPYGESLTTWWYFRQAYWYAITNGDELALTTEGGAVSYALSSAVTNSTNAIDIVQFEPWDPNRYVFYENADYFGSYFLGEGP